MIVVSYTDLYRLEKDKATKELREHMIEHSGNCNFVFSLTYEELKTIVVRVVQSGGNTV
jgi:hypothetical protein